MTESVKNPRALVVTSQAQMLDKLQVSEVTHVWRFSLTNAPFSTTIYPITRILFVALSIPLT